MPINESSCVSCGQCATVCPCNAMMEVNMEGNVGYMTDTEPGSLVAMIDLIKKSEPGYGPLLALSDSESEMRKERIKKQKQYVHIVVLVVHLKFGQKIEKF